MDMIENQLPLRIFCGYAHEDEALFQQLQTAFAVLRRQELIEVWHDREILAGAEWESEIKQQLHKADIILLLISPAFIASEYCWEKEMQWAIARHQAGEAHVIPIVLRPISGWKYNSLHSLLALPTDGKPITKWKNRDDAFVDVVNGLRKVIHHIQHDERYPVVGHSFLLAFTVFGRLEKSSLENAARQQAMQWLERVVKKIEGTLQETSRSFSDQVETQEWIFTTHQQHCHIKADYQIDANRDEEDNYFQIARVIVTTQNLTPLHQMIAEGQVPYQMLEWTLATKLDMDTIAEQICRRSGRDAWEESIYRRVTDNKYRVYELYSDSVKSIAVHLDAKAPQPRMSLVYRQRPYGFKRNEPFKGFYHAHQLFSARKALMMVLGEIPYSQIEQLVEQACTP